MLTQSYSALTEQMCFDSVEMKKQKQLSWNFTHYVFFPKITYSIEILLFW